MDMIAIPVLYIPINYEKNITRYCLVVFIVRAAGLDVFRIQKCKI